MSGMNGVFAKRRARLLAMKAIRDNHIPGDKAITCPKCGQDSDRKSVAQNLSVCPKCGYHFPIGAYYRLSTILDPGSFRELFEKLAPADPLSFPGYREKVEAAQRKTGLREAAVTATGTIGGRKCVVGVLDSRLGDEYRKLVKSQIPRADALVATKGRMESMMNVISACVEERRTVSMVVAIQNAAMVLGFVLVAFLACFGAMGQLTSLVLFLFQLFWVLVTLVLPKLRR